jgi:hypothetical protein
MFFWIVASGAQTDLALQTLCVIGTVGRNQGLQRQRRESIESGYHQENYADLAARLHASKEHHGTSQPPNSLNA